ncbi:peroxidase family protein [Chitinibacter sp. ZOR0017]|uniref:peroxidase family protein n=1 Tax=Chitinibacter sp. ZOR0017 TaxID=1339254 RepID=UPI0006492183|nr:peroxidase family protein [Chitinibacter sp. ZOR0017]
MSLISIAKVLKKIPGLEKSINRYATNKLCNATVPRPLAFGLWSHIPMQATDQGPPGEYTSWPMLTDRNYSSRHLPPASLDFIKKLPVDNKPIGTEFGAITNLFMRQGEMHTSRSSTLFMFFAQWFTDSVLRVHPIDRRMNTSNHNIDLCQIYGLTEHTAGILRSKKDGKLRSQVINGEEFLDYLGEIGNDGNWKVKTHYKNLPYVADNSIYGIISVWDKSRWPSLYATGLERGNSSVGYVAISTLFMREHNRICENLAKENPSWDDERLFQTARMINTVILMKLVVVDYINHISGSDIFEFDTKFAESKSWYRWPWISIEFDMLYRWHGLIPDSIRIEGKSYGEKEYRFNNSLLESVGLNAIIDAASKNAAGIIGLRNVPTFMAMAEYNTIKMGRDFRLDSFNKYREHFGFKPYSSFRELTGDANIAEQLSKLYGHVDNLEFITGLFAEKRDSDSLFGPLMNAMVAYDAFTQIYTNPLLSINVYHERTFSQYGLDLIEKTNSVQDLVDRNSPTGRSALASFSHSQSK